MAGKLFASFDDISQSTKDVLNSLGFERATPVQEATIPLFSGNKDVAVDACTGSGKTLAFIIPIIEKLKKLEHPLKRHQVGAVVVSPTRELSRQIHDVSQPFVASVPWVRSALLVGGTEIGVDVEVLKSSGAHVLIGTPGRLDDIFQRCSTFLDFKTVEILVLDEADRLLDMGFKKQLDSLMNKLPKQRRTGLFSATQTEAVEALARAGLRNPVRVAVAVTASATQKQETPAQQITPSTLRVQYLISPTHQKLERLIHFLRAHKEEKTIVYFLTCACVDYFSIVLKRLLSSSSQTKSKLNSAVATMIEPSLHSLHGRMKQSAREATLAKFASASRGILLATDVAARGLDIPDVNWVVQFDPPQDPAAFVHRCGRTARMGRSGSALVFLTPEEVSYVEFLKLRKVPMSEMDMEVATKGDDALDNTSCSDTSDVLQILRKEAESDREVLESGTKAFVSYIRAYKEHHCKYIFRIEDVAMGHLASSFALLQLPKMREVKKAARLAAQGQLLGFTPSTVDIEKIKFKDKAREKQRQATLKQRAAAKSSDEERALEQTNNDKSNKKSYNNNNSTHSKSGATIAIQPRLTAQKRRQLEARQELDDLQDEYALLRKLKKGKITQKQYEIAAGLVSDDDDDEEKGEKNKGNMGGRGNDQLELKTAKRESGQSSQRNDNGVAKVGSNNLVAQALAKKAKKKARKERIRAAKAAMLLP